MENVVSNGGDLDGREVLLVIKMQLPGRGVAKIGKFGGAVQVAVIRPPLRILYLCSVWARSMGHGRAIVKGSVYVYIYSGHALVLPRHALLALSSGGDLKENEEQYERVRIDFSRRET